MQEEPKVIQEDAVEVDKKPEPESPKPVSPRDQIISDLAAKRKAEIADTEAAEEATEEPTDEEKPSVKIENQMVELKVNGRQVWKTRQEVEDAGGITVIQKSLAAEERLAQSARERQELDRERQAFAQERQRIAEARKEPSPDIRERAKALTAKIFSGDEEEAEAALVEFMAAQSQPQSVQFDPEAMAEEAARRARWSMERETAASQFETDFQDVASNAQLREMADQKTVELMEANPDWTPRRIIYEAGQQVRDFVKSISPTADPLAQRQEEKKNLEILPKTTVRAQGQPVAKPKTKDELFAEIRRGRGQAF